MRTQEQWLGVVDCLGYLVCRSCNESGRGHRLDAYVFGAPHSEECCDFCGRRLVAEKSPAVAEKSPDTCMGPCESDLAAPCHQTCRWPRQALPGQGELPANLELDLRRRLPCDWLDWTPNRGPQ